MTGFDGHPDLDPERFVFTDDTWTATDMTRSHGRASRGERLADGLPPWLLQDDDADRGAAHERDGRADGAGRLNQ